jgi:DNA-binding MarR family transcriptional regulator
LPDQPRDLLNVLGAVGKAGAGFRSLADHWANTTTAARFGRKLKLTRHQILEALARLHAGEALTDIGRTFGVRHSTISRLRDWLPGNGFAEGQ